MSNSIKTTSAVSLCAFFSCVLGFQKSVGIFFIYFQESFDATVSEVSLVYSLSSAMMYLGGPFYGAFYKVAGIRASLLASTILLFASYIGTYKAVSFTAWITFYSVINGIGSGLAHIASFSAAAEIFTKKRSLVNNLMIACSSVTAMIAAPMFQHMMLYYSWRDIMLIMGGVVLNGLPFGWLASRGYNKARSELALNKTNVTVQISKINEHSTKTETSNFKQFSKFQTVCISFGKIFETSLLTDIWFLLFCFACIGLRGWRHLQTQYFVRYAEDIGIDNQSAATLLTIKLAMALIMCVVVGFITSADRNKSRIVLPQSSSIVISMAWCLTLINLIPLMWQCYYGYLAYSIACGIADGCIGTLPMTLMSVFFGRDRIAGALGFRSFITGAFNMAIPPLTGYLVEQTDSYKPVLYMSSALAFLGGTALLFVRCNIKISVLNIDGKKDEK